MADATTTVAWQQANCSTVSLQAVFVDVGGTLWPDSWPMTDAHRTARLDAVSQALPAGTDAARVIDAVDKATDPDKPADRSIADVLVDHRVAADEVTVRRVRQALCINLGRVITPLPGAADLLRGVKHLGLRCIVVSNTAFRDAAMYARDFAELGWDQWIDGCTTSVDVGVPKPDRRVFLDALTKADVAPPRCAMVGNSETADIAPAAALGLRTIRVAIEQPLPSASDADAVVGSLADALAILRSWASG